MVPELMMFQFMTFQPYNGVKEILIQQKLFLEFSIFSWTRQRPIVYSQPHNHKCRQSIHSQSFCTQTTILFFTFSIAFNKLLSPHFIIKQVLC